MSLISFENICKSYTPGTMIVDNLSLSIEKGEFITILGPSGCGKTTLLKMVNKLILPDSGNILVEDKAISDWDTIKLRRSIGYVIQQIGLFPHLTVSENISFVPEITGESKKFREDRSEELIELVGLPKEMLNRYPRALSGGQKQRIGVARALAANPDIILMDEPFGAVDEIARTQLQDRMLEIHNKLEKTILFVTHDIEEALKLGTKIIIMNNGNIEQMGTSEELVYNPATPFVEEFLGEKGYRAIMKDDILKKMFDNDRNTYRHGNSLHVTDSIGA